MGIATGIAYQKGEATGKVNSDNVVDEITEEWFVRTAFGADMSVALAATGLPAVNSPHGVYENLLVSGYTPRREPNGIIWQIDVNYAIVAIAKGEDAYKLVRIEYGTHELQQDVTHNLGTGAPLMNTNGDTFQNTIQIPRSYPYIKIIKKQRTSDREDVITKSGSINSAAVTVAGITVPKWVGRIKISAVEQENETYDWEISYEILFKYFDLSNYLDFTATEQAGPSEVGWMEGVVNRGFYYYNGGSEKFRALEMVEKADGSLEQKATASPVPLAADGTLLAEAATPLSILLQVYPDADWSGLGLNDL